MNMSIKPSCSIFLGYKIREQIKNTAKTNKTQKFWRENTATFRRDSKKLPTRNMNNKTTTKTQTKPERGFCSLRLKPVETGFLTSSQSPGSRPGSDRFSCCSLSITTSSGNYSDTHQPALPQPKPPAPVRPADTPPRWTGIRKRQYCFVEILDTKYALTHKQGLSCA